MKKIRATIILLITVLIFRFLLDYWLIAYIVPKWQYLGFYSDFNTTNALVTYIITFILALNMTRFNYKNAAHFLVMLLFYVMYIPIGSIATTMNKSIIPFFMSSFSILIIQIFTFYFNVKSGVRLIDKKSKNKNKVIFWILSIVSIYTLVVMTALNYKNITLDILFNLQDVYEIRDLANYSLGMNYFFSWQSKIINPFIILVSHHQNNNKTKYLFICFQLWLFILTGHKSVLMSLFLILGALYFPKIYRYFFSKISVFMIMLLSIPFIEITISNNSVLLDYIVRRVFYIPALLTHYYYDYFSNNGFLYWRDTLIGRIFGLSSDISTPKLIGEVYFGREDMNAVTGFLGAEYANAGFIGIIISTILVIIIIKMIKQASEEFSNEIVIAIMILPIYGIWNSSMLTNLLTGGIIISLLLLKNFKYETRSVSA